MSLFSQHLAETQRLRAAGATPEAEAPVEQQAEGIADVSITATELTANATSEFEEQRIRRAKEQTAGLESHTALESEVNGTPVDGTDDNLTVPAGDTEIDLPEGEFGKVVEPEGDTVDADDSEVFDEDGNAVMERELDMVEQDDSDIEMLNTEMLQLLNAGVAVESFGFNPTAAAIMQTTGLLDGTALQSLGLESISVSSGDDAESMMALEALGEKMKEKAAQWGAKILSVVKNSGEKILGALTPLFDKIGGLVSKMSAKAWDKTKTAGAVARAHPYTTIAAVIAAIAATAGIVAFVASGAPAAGAKVEVLKSMLNAVKDRITGIKFPGGKITAALSKGGDRLILGFEKAAGVAKEAALSTLGWTQPAIKAINGQLDRAWGAVKMSWNALSTRTTKIATSVIDTSGQVVMGGIGTGVAAANMAGGTAVKVLPATKAGGFVAKMVGNQVGFAAGSAYIMSIVGIVAAMFRLTRFVVVGGFRMIAGTFRALMPKVSMA